MTHIPFVRRVIVVVLDGLRPDAIDAFGLSHIRALCARGAFTLQGRTVTPSVTAAAMTSLVTGVEPRVHGVQSDAFHLPVPRAPIHPVTRELRRCGMPVAVHAAALPFAYRALAHSAGLLFGATSTTFRGDTCREILDGARGAIARQQQGFMLMHWPDADRVGHAHGWMSPAYADAARRMDDALGVLTHIALDESPGTLLIAVADHGGGGINVFDHDSDHPTDQTIPIVLAGNNVAAGPLMGPVSLLDIPPTVLWALGVAPPRSYAGHALTEAFTRLRSAA